MDSRLPDLRGFRAAASFVLCWLLQRLERCISSYRFCSRFFFIFKFTLICTTDKVGQTIWICFLFTIFFLLLFSRRFAFGYYLQTRRISCVCRVVVNISVKIDSAVEPNRVFVDKPSCTRVVISGTLLCGNRRLPCSNHVVGDVSYLHLLPKPAL